MGAVIALDRYRERKRSEALGLRSGPGARPEITDGDILGRDYAKFRDVVHGLLKVRQVMDHYLPYDEEWKHHLLCLLNAAYHRGAEGVEELHQSVAALRRLAAVEMEGADPAANRDFSCVLLILDLMDKVQARAMA